MVPILSQGGKYWGVGGVGGLFGPPAENFGMTSTTFFFTLLSMSMSMRYEYEGCFNENAG
jgi:hypothetical protein